MRYCLFILWVCFAFTTSLYGQDRYCWSEKGQHHLNENTSSLILHVKNSQTLHQLEARAFIPGIERVMAFNHKLFAVVQINSDLISKTTFLEQTGIDASEVRSISNGYSLNDGFTTWPTHQVIFKLKNRENLQVVNEILAEYGANYQPSYSEVMIVDIKDVDRVFELGLTSFSHPDFYAPITRSSDPLYPDQFQMNNTGQVIDGYTGVVDMDCNAVEAWTISTGASSITVAVIEDGVEDHEDLEDGGGALRVVGGYTPATGGSGAPESDGEHGQACAGIIAASHNSLGVKGVAPLVDVLTVNIFYGGETISDLANGITWAKDNGADVMSNSWTFTSCTVSYGAINDALQDAVDNGQGGLGCVIAFSSGNDYASCINYPSDNDNVLGVGAFTQLGEHSNYSNAGPELDLVAPSNAAPGQNGAGVRTIDREGAPGYSTGNYFNGFGGTSAACPVVAGVAALVIAVDDQLTHTEVKNILILNAIDMAPAGFDNEYANGRVNAYAAVQAAGGTAGPPTCTDGIQNGDETGIDCGGPDCDPCPLLYCNSSGSNTNYEWIDRVQIANIDNTSGSDGGYGDYTTQVANLDADATYNVVGFPVKWTV